MNACDIPARWEDAERLATQLRTEGRSDEAEQCYRVSLQRFPDNVALMNALGLFLVDAGRPHDAVQVLARALQLSPLTGALAFNLGNALRAGGDGAGAVRAYERALALGLDLPEVFNNFGVALQHEERWDDALLQFGEALRRDGRYLPALANSGYAMIQAGRPAEAIDVLRKAVGLQPDYADAHWLLSHALLVTGCMPEGWDEYEWRWHRMKSVTYHRGTVGSQWRGEAIAGKRILVYAEQGIGDAVQFVRYVPRIAALGATVYVECHAGLVPLLRTVEGVTGVYARGEALPSFDTTCPLLSLPSVFRTTLEDLRQEGTYLYPDPERVVRWRTALEPFGEVVRVGLVWAGSAAHTNDRKRSLRRELLETLAALAGVRFFSLQKGDADDPRCAAPRGLPLSDWSADLRDFADTAALMCGLDLVITVDTAVAHVAGALGVPVWLMVPFAPDWRWMLGRSDSPWYPSMRLFRQLVAGDWGAVVTAVREVLAGVSRPSH